MAKKPIDLILIYAMWIVFACLEGVREAATFAHGGYLVEYPYNIHLWFMPVRGLLFASCAYLFFRREIKGFWLFIIALFCCFAFWHDGLYYETRSLLDYPAYHFFASSQTTTAVHSYGAIVRILGKVISLAAMVIIWSKNKTGQS